MSGGSGQARLLPMVKDVTNNIRRQLLVRQPPTLAKVPLNGVMISQMKQKLPTFRAIELTSLNERFALTFVEKPTVSLKLKMDRHDDNSVQAKLSDERRNVVQLYKERQHTLPIEDFAGLLKYITSKGIIRSLDIDANDPVLQLLLQAEKLSPTRLRVWHDADQEYLLPLIQRLASKVQELDFMTFETDTNWLQLERCLAPFTKLQRLFLFLNEPLPPPVLNWLTHAIMANDQLKWLAAEDELFFSPVISVAVSTIAHVDNILFECHFPEQLVACVDTDLCAPRGQCSLTKLVLEMPPAGRLALIIQVSGVFTGALLRLCHYLLSLHKTGKTVLVKVKHFPIELMPAFIEDIDHFYHPLTEIKTKPGVYGIGFYHHRVSLGTIAIYLYD